MPGRKTYTIGDTIELPSGLRIKATATAVKGHPWVPVDRRHLWHVGRLPIDGQGLTLQFYFGGGKRPLQLDKGDAVALADALSRVKETGT